MSRRHPPMRRLRDEMFPLGIAFAVPLALAALFPCGGWVRGVCLPFGDRTESLTVSPREACCAFVTLTPEQEAQARITARTAWQRDRVTSRQTRIDMFANALPPMTREPVLGFSSTARSAESVEPYVAPIRLPSLAAPPPESIAPSPEKGMVPPTFSRDEMLAPPTTNYPLPTNTYQLTPTNY